MPVTVNEIVEIVDVAGERHEGKAIATNLTCLENPDGGHWYGKLTKMVRLETTIVCDNEKCEHGHVDENFHTQPKTISFVESEGASKDFIKDIADVIITSDFEGNKLVFCSLECLAAKSKRIVRQVVEMPSGKGKRTFEPEVLVCGCIGKCAGHDDMKVE